MKSGLTFEQHCEIAERLATVRHELLDLFMKIQHAYPKSSPCVSALNKLTGLCGPLDTICCDLDSKLSREHPQQFHPGIYYGKKVKKTEGDKLDGPTRTKPPA